jgi:hypothetical protein
MFEKKPKIDKKNPEKDRKCAVRADLVPDTPEDNLDLDSQQVKDKQEYEPLVIVPELLIILFERVDTRDHSKEGHT